MIIILQEPHTVTRRTINTMHITTGNTNNGELQSCVCAAFILLNLLAISTITVKPHYCGVNQMISGDN